MTARSRDSIIRDRERGHGSVVERLLPKQNVAGSNPAARSYPPLPRAGFCINYDRERNCGKGLGECACELQPTLDRIV